MLFKTKLKIFVFFLVALFFASLAYAEFFSFRTYKDSYSPFETVQLEIYIENVSLSRDLSISHLQLFDQENNSVLISRNIVKVNDSFYVYYFDLPNLSPGSYSLALSDVAYVYSNINRFGDFSTNLNVVNFVDNVVSIRPAYNFYELNSGKSTSFSLVLSNRGSKDVQISLSRDGDFFQLQYENFVLMPGKIKSVGVFVDLDDVGSQILDGNIRVSYESKFYDVPLLIRISDFDASRFVNRTTTIDQAEYTDLSGVSDAIFFTTLAGRKLNNLTLNLNINEYYPPGQIVVNNNAPVDLHNVRYYLSGEIANQLGLQPEENDLIIFNTSSIISLSVNSSYNFLDGNFNGYLNVESAEGAKYSFPVTINVIGVGEGTQTNISVEEHKELNESTIDQETPIVEDKSNFGLWLFFLILFLLLIILFFIYRKTKIKREEFENFIERVKQK